MKILLVSDIHGNYPALRAVEAAFPGPFDLVINGGDTTVYAPFPNQTIDWLRERNTLSILGNTDRLVAGLLRGKSFRKPRKADKRIMYGWTAAELSDENRRWLLQQPDHRVIPLPVEAGKKSPGTLGIYHGSPADPDEFLFATTPLCRFRELAATVSHTLVTIGHSHSPFHKVVDGVHFVNPGSTGRMFDGKKSAACAVIELKHGEISVHLHRIDYPVEAVIEELKRLHLPSVYQEMFRLGRKLN